MSKYRYFFLVLVLAACISTVACDNPADPTGCTYDIGSSTDISGVTVFYPCGAAAASGVVYNTVTLSGGFTNTKDDMYWLANYLVQQNIIVFAVSAASNTSVTNYEKTHKACFNLINSENARSSSPVFGKIGSIGLIGYSMGGGGVLNASQDMGSQVDAVVALAAWGPETNLSATTAPTLLLVGATDNTAPPGTYSEPAYANLPDAIDKACALIGDGFTHLDYIGDNDEIQHPAKVMVAAWLSYMLDGDASALETLIEPPSPITYYNQNFF